MPDTAPETLIVERVTSIDAVPQPVWDACAGTNPFVSHGFLKAMEDSGSVGRGAGWLPQHLVAKQDGAIVGVVPAERVPKQRVGPRLGEEAPRLRQRSEQLTTRTRAEHAAAQLLGDSADEGHL